MSVTQLASSLTGSWILHQWTTQSQDADGNLLKTHYPFGERPDGLLIYSPDGFVSATVCRSGRPRVSQSVSPRQLSADVQAEAFKSFFHYAGRWAIADGQVRHEVSLALNPNMVGTVQLRSPSFNERGLSLEGMELIGDNKRRHVIQWTKPQNAPQPAPSVPSYGVDNS
ncbi:MAG: lipocalin-like domain-containing protein [Lysobacterales bacterium]